MRFFARTFPLVALAVAACLCLPQAAQAHANLLQTLPQDGTVLRDSPASIELLFDDTVSPIAFTLEDDARHVLPGGKIETLADGKRLRMVLPQTLVPGGYRVLWRILSDDGHPEGNVYVFRVGPGPMPSKLLGVEDGWAAIRIFMRAIRDLAFLLAAGATLFGLLVEKSFVTPVRGIALVGLAAALADYVLFRLEVGAQLAPIWSVLTVSAGFTLVAVGGRWTGVAGAGLTALGLVLVSHVGKEDIFPAPVLGIHMLAAAFWLGSLWPLWGMLAQRQDAALAMHRFSRLALGGVVVLLLSGLYLAITQVKSFAGLVNSTYGLLLLGKISLVACVLAIAALNKYRFTPRLPKSAPGFLLSIDIELAIMAMIVAITAILAESPVPQ